MNNEKYLKGLKIHHPTISELMARRIKEAAAGDKKLDEQINKAMTKGIPYITFEHDQISISSPDRIEPNDDPSTNSEIRRKWLEGINDHGPSDPVKVRYFKQDGDKIVEQKTIDVPTEPTKDAYDLLAELSEESKFDLYTKESMTMARVMAHFIEQQDGPRSDYDYDKMMGGNFNNDLVGIVNIHGKDKIGFEECANRIATLAKQHYVVIIQSVFGFGDTDVPFTMFIRDMCGHVEAAWLDADWEYFRVNNAGDKWKPCYDSYIEDRNMDKRGPASYLNSDTFKKVNHLMDETVNNFIQGYKGRRGIEVTDDNLRDAFPALAFWRYLARTEDCICTWDCNIDEFEEKLSEYIKSEYLRTPEQYLKNYPDTDETLEEIKEHLDWDPDEDYECSFYVIFAQ